MTEEDFFRECKKTAKSYISPKRLLKNSIRRRDGMREMIYDLEKQLIVIKNAEASLSEQIDQIEMSPHYNERKKFYGRKN